MTTVLLLILLLYILPMISTYAYIRHQLKNGESPAGFHIAFTLLPVYNILYVPIAICMDNDISSIVRKFFLL